MKKEVNGYYVLKKEVRYSVLGSPFLPLRWCQIRLLTLNIVAGEKLQDLINENDGERELQDHHPLLNGQMGQLKDHLDRWRGGNLYVSSTVEVTMKQQNVGQNVN